MRLKNFDIIDFGNEFYGLVLTNIDDATQKETANIRLVEINTEKHSYWAVDWIKNIPITLQDEYNGHEVKYVLRPKDATNIYHILCWSRIYDDNYTTEMYDYEYD